MKFPNQENRQAPATHFKQVRNAPQPTRLYVYWLHIFVIALAIGIGALIGTEFVEKTIIVATVTVAVLILTVIRVESAYPNAVFYILIGSVYVLGVVNSPIDESMIYIGISGILLVFLLVSLLTREINLNIDAQSAVWALALASWAIIPALLSPSFVLIRVYWFVAILFIFIPTFIQSSQQLRLFIWNLVVWTTIASIMALFAQIQVLINLGNFDVSLMYRAIDQESMMILDDGAILASRLTKSIPFVVVFLFSSHLRFVPRVFLIVILLLIVIVSVLFFSNNVLIGLFLTFLLSVFLMPLGKRQKAIVMSALIAALMLFGWLGLDTRLVEQVELVASGENFFLWGSTRGLKFYMAWQSILASPWLGYGPAQAGNVLPNFVPLEFLGRGSNAEFAVPHNMLLSLWVDLGVLGVVFFLGLYGSICVRLWQAAKRVGRDGRSLDEMIGYGILIALIVYFVQGMFISIQVEKLMWILLGSGIAFIRLAERGAFLSVVASDARARSLPS